MDNAAYGMGTCLWIWGASYWIRPFFLHRWRGLPTSRSGTLALRCGAGLVVSEMVASAEVVQAKPSARARAELGFGRGRTAVQLAGREARWMAEAARYCAAEGARIIDINFGCPAKKVTNGLSGSALMRDPHHALRLIDAVVGAVEVPVTLKMRLGWDAGSMNAAEIAARAEAAGVRMITVHGRTRCQFYSGAADWAAIARVRRAVRIPVVANGDIVDATTARRALARSGADAVMIGRGARGRPWLLAEVAAALAGRPRAPTAFRRRAQRDRLRALRGDARLLRPRPRAPRRAQASRLVSRRGRRRGRRCAAGS